MLKSLSLQRFFAPSDDLADATCTTIKQLFAHGA
jgi:hypothetical protein